MQTTAVSGHDCKIVRDMLSLFHLWRKAVIVRTVGMAGQC